MDRGKIMVNLIFVAGLTMLVAAHMRYCMVCN